MKTKKNSYLRNFCVAALVSLLAQCVWAAAKPLVVWEASDFAQAGTVTKGDLKLTLPTDATYSTADKSVQIKDTGLKIDVPSTITNPFGTGNSTTIQVLVKFSNFPVPTADNKGAVVAAFNNEYLGSCIIKGGISRGIWNGNTIYNTSTGWPNKGSESVIVTTSDTVQKYVMSYTRSSSTIDGLNVTYEGVGGYLGGQIAYGCGALKASPTISSIVIGGKTGAGSNFVVPTGMKVYGIALFTSTNTPSDLDSYVWPSEQTSRHEVTLNDGDTLALTPEMLENDVIAVTCNGSVSIIGITSAAAFAKLDLMNVTGDKKYIFSDLSDSDYSALSAPANGETYRFEGTTALTTLPFLKKNSEDAYDFGGNVEIAKAVTISGQLAPYGNKGCYTIVEGGSISANYITLANKGGVTQNFVQNGGTVTATSSNAATATNAAMLLGHWGSTANYTVNGGTLSVVNAPIRLGWDGTGNLTVAGGTVTTAGFRGGNQNGHAGAGNLTLTSGKIVLGASGIDLGANGSVTLSGGTIEATKNATISVNKTNGFALTGKTVIDVAKDKTLTLNSTLVASSGAYIEKKGDGTLDLGMNRPTMDIFAGDVKLVARGEEVVNGKINLTVVENAQEASTSKVIVVDEAGNNITVTDVTITGTECVLTLRTLDPITKDSQFKAISALNLSGKSGTLVIQGADTATDAYTVTFDDVIPEGITIQVVGHVKLAVGGSVTEIPYSKMFIDEGATVTVDKFSGSSIHTGTTINATTISGTIENNGILNMTSTDGNVTLTNNGTMNVGGTCAIRLTNNGTINVTAGTCTVTKTDNQSVKGTVNIAKNATLAVTENDGVSWSETGTTINVRGTLNMGNFRWTVGGNSVINLYGGCTVEGSGDNDALFDLYRGGTVIAVKQGVEGANEVIVNNLRTRNNNSEVFIEDGMSLVVSTGIWYSQGEGTSFTKTGQGNLTIRGQTSTADIVLAAGTIISNISTLNVTSGAVGETVRKITVEGVTTYDLAVAATITIPSVDHTTVTATVNGVTVDPSSGSLPVYVGDAVVVTYSAAEGYMMTDKVVNLDVTESTTISAPEGMTPQLIVAKIGDTPYASVQDAIDNLGENETITLIDTTATLPTSYAKVTKDGVVTLRQSGDVYYVQGYFTTGTDQNPLELVTEDGGATTFLDGDKIIVGSKTSKTEAWFSADSRLTKLQFSKDFTMHAGTTDAILNNATITVDDGKVLTISPDRANTKLGAVTISGAVSVSGTTPLAFASVEGTSTITLADGKSITIGTKAETVTIASGVATKRVVATEVAGGIKYSLETIQPEPPTPSEDGITPSIPGAQTIKIVDAEGTTVEGGSIPLVTGVYTVTGKVGETVVATETLAVVKTKEEETPDEGQTKADAVTTAVAVPFTGATVANLLNTALLSKGDILKAIIPATQNYQSWELQEDKTWAPINTIRAGGTDTADDPATTELPRGSAVWVTTAGQVVAFGAYDSTTPADPVVVSGYNLIGNPKMTAITPEAKTVGDVLIPIGSTELVRYTVIEKAGGTKVWQCSKTVRETTDDGETIDSEDISEGAPSVKVGGSVWLVAK